jgi:hypothetical protein
VFERCLLEFVNECLNSKRTVWLSHIQDAFVDIKDVKLLSVLPGMAHNPAQRIPYVYAGAKRGFVPDSELGQCRLVDGDAVCAVSTCYPPLAHVRECRLLLEDGLRRLG